MSTAADAAKRRHHRKHCRPAFLLLFFNSVYLYTRVDGASICCSKASGTMNGASICCSKASGTVDGASIYCSKAGGTMNGASIY